MKTCRDCFNFVLCSNRYGEIVTETGTTNVARWCNYFKNRKEIVESSCMVGTYIFVSPDNGQHFYKAQIYGCTKKCHFLVQVDDKKLLENDKHNCEIKHNIWIEDDNDIVCTNCKTAFDMFDNDVDKFNFCPNCGAEMDEE